MKEIREIVSENLTNLRKEKKLTQAELAEKINYSDKAVSKWENGDTLPDLETLQKICDFYNVTLDYLTHEGSKKEKSEFVMDKNKVRNRIAITILVCMSAFLLATVMFVYSILIVDKTNENYLFWPAFVWTVPVCSIFTLICNRLFFRNTHVSFIFSSILLWSAITGIYVNLSFYNSESWGALWPIYLMGVPLQIALAIWMEMFRKDK